MVERRVTVAAPEGLHARPAALFVQAATAAAVPVTIAKDGRDPVSARSILAVLSLDVRGGDEVVLAGDGAAADQAVADLATLLATPDPAAAPAPVAGPVADGRP